MRLMKKDWVSGRRGENLNRQKSLDDAKLGLKNVHQIFAKSGAQARKRYCLETNDAGGEAAVHSFERVRGTTTAQL